MFLIHDKDNLTPIKPLFGFYLVLKIFSRFISFFGRFSFNFGRFPHVLAGSL